MPTFKMSAFQIFPVFKGSNFGSPLYCFVRRKSSKKETQKEKTSIVELGESHPIVTVEIKITEAQIAEISE